MTSLFFGSLVNESVPADENVVRNTATSVERDARPAEMEKAPDWNQPLQSDSNPHLGMVNRQLAGAWQEGEQYRPFWIEEVTGADAHNGIIDRQVSSSGTAAQREASGVFGHGTLKYSAAIEPVSDLRDGGHLGNDYFSAGKPDIQSTTTPSMSIPPGLDHASVGMISDAGKRAARISAAAGLYDAWYNGAKS